MLFGLDEHEKGKGHTFASTVRRAIGPTTKFIIVTGWNSSLFAKEKMKEEYSAKYMSRGGSISNLAATVLEMLK